MLVEIFLGRDPSLACTLPGDSRLSPRLLCPPACVPSELPRVFLLGFRGEVAFSMEVPY